MLNSKLIKLFLFLTAFYTNLCTEILCVSCQARVLCASRVTCKPARELLQRVMKAVIDIRQIVYRCVGRFRKSEYYFNYLMLNYAAVCFCCIKVLNLFI